MLRLGCIERKEKGKTEVQEDQRGLLPILSSLSRQRKFYHDKVFLALFHDRVFHVATGFSRQAHNLAWAGATGMHKRDRAFWPCGATWISVSR